eukprot:CAMPEP_0168498532 /NCGR_PEP_ID=MMETSP0228-20121227/73325_1 /TAXON_ID=133427 /ORGANISM="Protoceratium reticulatum, Strain CCCM 535 (=CCMP 1889)" /LENGTH=33 /DNA_ID= /DNA_START= /DNA_END= /DNA_ORIENTATION=
MADESNDRPIRVTAFDTEDVHDVLTINGIRYSG